MSGVIARMAAEGEWLPMPGAEGVADEAASRRQRRDEESKESEPVISKLARHDFPSKPPLLAEAAGCGAPAEEMRLLDPEEERRRRIYRKRTVAMLRRYMRYSMETGRLPSLLGTEFFRTKVTSYSVSTFEDRVIFVHDMERCLEKLDELARQVLLRVVLQEYEHEEAARLLGCTRMTVHRKLVEALDRLGDVLLEVGLLEALDSIGEKCCQEGERDDFSVSDCEEGK